MMMLIHLMYLASGCSLQEIHYSYRVDRWTAGEIVRRFYRAVWKREKCIPKPDKKMWKEIANEFERRANFLHCLGAVDGKHIRVVKAEKSDSLCYNYKNYFSISLMAVADSNYRFVYVDIGSFGKDADPTIFQNSSLWKNLENDTLDIPDQEKIPGIDIPLPFAFIGDDAFPLSKHLLKP
ncbi:hypothetical protein NQ314_008812 [Rhamnusium bicolor]|uniref:DDE Tnp4 domain-containing protein n=1 Tax=Rhamnusium bicolor TaxID=1586634 RepID=A0AAV8Y6K6_9CUCU|nr:hypothetical protein NQ314_008812 [Rhamnusium bicolor]